MPYFVKASHIALISATGLALLTSEAAAQYYSPVVPQSYGQTPIGLGLDLGLQNGGLSPNVGFGLGQLGAGVGAGINGNGIGTGVNAGVGPLGLSVDGGLGRNGLGASTSAGIGNTGASFEGGLSGGGLGLGTSARVLGFGPAASLGIGNRGPGLGASMAFGPLGTLLIGSHRNSYPGAQRTASHAYPSQNASYYTARNYANTPYYRPVQAQYGGYTQHTRPISQYPAQRLYSLPSCPSRWTC